MNQVSMHSLVHDIYPRYYSSSHKKSGSTAFKPVLPLFCEFIPLLYNIRNTLLFNNFPSSLQNKLGDASKPDTTPEPPYRHEYIRNCDTATPLHLL